MAAEDGRGHTVLPLIEELTGVPEPVEACERFAGLPYRLFLDSALTHPRLGRWSFLMADPVAVVRTKGGRTELLGPPEWQGRPAHCDLLTTAQGLLGSHRAVSRSDAPPFLGGAAGYLAYEWGRTLEKIPAARYDDLGLWDAVLGLYDCAVAWDHQHSRVWLVSSGLPEEDGARRARRARDRAATVRAWLDGRGEARQLGHEMGLPTGRVSTVSISGAPSYPLDMGQAGSGGVRSSFARAEYLSTVSRVRELIRAGDIFQANLTQRLEAPWPHSPWTLYRRLRDRNPAPFAAFVELPEVAILSASPERFLRVDGQGGVETRPIKGTRPRSPDPETDAALGRALLESPKDRAENLMIVDLMRNDLSRVCRPGSVQVPELFALERYATVQHLVSTVVGMLEEGRDAADLLRATFPGGSITGAPKIRAMEIITELEPPCRGVYCGAIGYWSLSGELDMSIAIRTAVVTEGRVYFGTGGGIIADSDPAEEYEETLDKARAFLETLAALA